MSIEAMKRWLAVLEAKDTCGSSIREARERAITEMKQAIEQAQKQEPVAWLSKGGKGIWFHEPDASLNATPLYTAPQRQPLSDEEILAVARDHYNPHQRSEISFARAIEAAHGIKGEA